jgi:hypothetical protein
MFSPSSFLWLLDPGSEISDRGWKKIWIPDKHLDLQLSIRHQFQLVGKCNIFSQSLHRNFGRLKKIRSVLTHEKVNFLFAIFSECS